MSTDYLYILKDRAEPPPAPKPKESIAWRVRYLDGAVRFIEGPITRIPNADQAASVRMYKPAN